MDIQKTIKCIQNKLDYHIMPCSLCGMSGHNVRTCLNAEPDFISFDREVDKFDITDDFDHDDVVMGMDELVGNEETGDTGDTGETVGELEDGFVLSISESDDEFDSDDEEDEANTPKSVPTTSTTPYDCPICMETLDEDTDGVVKLGCSHKFCPGCFVKHMRGANQCAMCRAKVCEKPKKPKSKHMSVREKFDVVSDLVWHSDMVDEIHDRIMNDARKKLITASGNVETKYVSETMVRIKDFVSEEDIRKATIMSAFRVVDRMSEWYGDESSSRIEVTWGGERFNIA